MKPISIRRVRANDRVLLWYKHANKMVCFYGLLAHYILNAETRANRSIGFEIFETQNKFLNVLKRANQNGLGPPFATAQITDATARFQYYSFFEKNIMGYKIFKTSL